MRRHPRPKADRVRNCNEKRVADMSMEMSRLPASIRSSNKRITRGNLHDEVVSVLRDMIIQDELSPGTRILEAQLCAMLGISRTPLREAIRVGADGFISKDTPGKRLGEMVEDAVSGLAPLPPKFASRVLTELREPKSNELKSMGRLTPRELAVLTGVVKGGTNKQIAGTLNVSKSTVNHHLSNVLAKFHLSNRAEAAAYAVRQGLVQDEADR